MTDADLYNAGLSSLQHLWRRYGMTEVRTRLLPAYFRCDVLGEYGNRWGVSCLGECSVLDIADLVPNREELGRPKISNGLALYTLEHRVFDRHIIGTTPEFRERAFRDWMERAEGEETVDAIVQYDGQRLRLPYEEAQWPDRERVAWRWEEAQVG